MRARIDPGTSEQISLNPREPSLSVDPTIEGLRPLPSCQVAVPGLASDQALASECGPGRRAPGAHNYDTHRQGWDRYYYGAGAVHAAGLAR